MAINNPYINPWAQVPQANSQSILELIAAQESQIKQQMMIDAVMRKRASPDWDYNRDVPAVSQEDPYFDQNQTIRKMENKHMNKSTAVFLINDSVRCVETIYEKDGEKGPDWKAPRTLFKSFDHSLKEGDLVIVPTNTRHGFTVVKVTNPDAEFNIDTTVEMKWIVGKVDTAGHEQTLKQEAEMLKVIESAERRKKRDELKKAVLADQEENIKALAIAHVGGDTTLPG